LTAPRRRRFARLALRIGAGLGLLALMLHYADPRLLLARLAGVDSGWFAFALACAIAANIVSARRWSSIAQALSLQAPLRLLLPMYARGITLNVLLPGASLSGDLLRSVELSRLGNGFARSALSVFMDRVSGLWILCALSLAATLAAGALGRLPGFAGALWYALALAGAVAAPLLPWPARSGTADGVSGGTALGQALAGALGKLRAARAVLLGSAALSLLVQLLSAVAFWGCAEAVRIDLGLAVLTAAAAPIFAMAALPIGVAGFGLREAAAVVVLGVLGVPADQAMASAVLYGVCALIQGLLAAPLLLLRR